MNPETLKTCIDLMTCTDKNYRSEFAHGILIGDNSLFVASGTIIINRDINDTKITGFINYKQVELMKAEYKTYKKEDYPVELFNKHITECTEYPELTFLNDLNFSHTKTINVGKLLDVIKGLGLVRKDNVEISVSNDMDKAPVKFESDDGVAYIAPIITGNSK